MTSMRHSLVWLLALGACNLGPFVIGESATDSDGATTSANGTSTGEGLSSSASVSADETFGGNDLVDVGDGACETDCAPTFSWCWEQGARMHGIEWDPQAQEIVALLGIGPSVVRLDPQGSTAADPFTLVDAPDWDELDFSIGPNGGVALLFDTGASQYVAQTRPSDMGAVYAQLSRVTIDFSSWDATDVALDAEGRTIVVGYLADPEVALDATFVDVWDVEGALAWSAQPAIHPLLGADILGVDDGAPIVWIQGSDPEGFDNGQFVRWYDALGVETGAREIEEFPIIGPAVRDGDGFRYVVPEPRGLSIHTLDGDFFEVDADYDLYEEGEPDVDPSRIVMTDEGVHVVAIYDPLGANELQIRSYGPDGSLDHIVPFPPLVIDTPGPAIEDVVVADGAIFVAGEGFVGEATSSFVCRIDP